MCKSCFDDWLEDEIEISDDEAIPKNAFVKTTFSRSKPESVIECSECERIFHRICVGYIPQFWRDENEDFFTCEECVQQCGMEKILCDVEAKGKTKQFWYEQ